MDGQRETKAPRDDRVAETIRDERAAETIHEERNEEMFRDQRVAETFRDEKAVETVHDEIVTEAMHEERNDEASRDDRVAETFREEETFEIGRQLGADASAGQIYCLLGDLGVGKTVFTKGFAKGLGIEDVISSPTFTILQEYEDGRLPLYHFDVYRIADPLEMDEIGFEEFLYGNGVCLIEWANLIEELIPPFATKIYIEKDPEKGFDYRKITVV